MDQAGRADGISFTPFQTHGINPPLFAGLLFDGHQHFAAASLAFESNTSAEMWGLFVPSSLTQPRLNTVTPIANNQFSISLTGVPGLDYAIQFSSNLSQPNWMPLTTNSTGAGTSFTTTDTAATNATRIYRAIKQRF